MKSHSFRKLAPVIPFMLIVSGCNVVGGLFPSPTPTVTPTATPTITPTQTPTLTHTPSPSPTATPIPFVERDLSQIVLQKADLAGDYSELPARSGAGCMSDIYADFPEVHANLTQGYNRTLESADTRTSFDTSIFIYANAGSASSAFQRIAAEKPGQPIEISPLGDEQSTSLLHDRGAQQYRMTIIWRKGTAVMELLAITRDAPETEALAGLAGLMQKRLEQPPPTPPGSGGSGRIAFETDNKVFTVNADGSGLTCILNSSYISLVFSPNGQWIALEKFAGEGNYEMYVADRFGGRISFLASGGSPKWSPDGSGILFSAYPEWHLTLVSPDGGRFQEITRYMVGSYTWYKDSGRVIFLDIGYPDSRIQTMNIDGSDRKTIGAVALDEHDFCCTWSPDFTQFLFESYRGYPTETVLHTFIANIDGSGLRQFTDNPSGLRQASWSPDGTKILYSLDYFMDIYIANSDGSGATRLTDNPGLDWCPSWSPDGSKIAYISQHKGPYEVYVMNADGSNQTKVATINDRIFGQCPVWEP